MDIWIKDINFVIIYNFILTTQFYHFKKKEQNKPENHIKTHKMWNKKWLKQHYFSNYKLPHLQFYKKWWKKWNEIKLVQKKKKVTNQIWKGLLAFNNFYLATSNSPNTPTKPLLFLKDFSKLNVKKWAEKTRYYSFVVWMSIQINMYICFNVLLKVKVNFDCVWLQHNIAMMMMALMMEWL